MSADTLQLIILPAGIIAVLFAVYLARDVLARDTGTKEMEDVAGTIFEGAVAFIRRQYTTIGVLAVVGAFVIAGVITIFETEKVADTKTFGLALGWRTGRALVEQGEDRVVVGAQPGLLVLVDRALLRGEAEPLEQEEVRCHELRRQAGLGFQVGLHLNSHLPEYGSAAKRSPHV